MQISLVFLFLFFSQITLSQSVLILSNSDSSTIPFANISFFMQDSLLGGTYSNENGKFSIKEPHISEIKLSHISYVDTSITRNNLNERDTVYLTPHSTTLDEVSISAVDSESAQTVFVGLKPEKTKILFWEKTKKRTIQKDPVRCERFYSGMEVLRFQPGVEDNEKTIKSFVFYSDVIDENTDFIVKAIFYSNDNQIPAEKIPVEVVRKLTQNDHGRIEINVSQLGITLPPEGLFIGLEFVGCNENIVEAKNKENFKGVRTFYHLREEDQRTNELVYWNHKLRKEPTEPFVKKRFFDIKKPYLTVPMFGLELIQ